MICRTEKATWAKEDFVKYRQDQTNNGFITSYFVQDLKIEKSREKLSYTAWFLIWGKMDCFLRNVEISCYF